MDREQLLRGYPAERSRLRASLERLVGPADAEDLANETLLRALSAVDSFRGEASLGTWLHRIGVNLAYDLLRSRSRNPVLAAEHGNDLPETADEAINGEQLERRQMSLCVQNLLAELPPQQRQILAQADMLDQTVAQIARDAGITTGNAKIRLHRARRAVKAVLESHCDLEHQGSGVLCCEPKTASAQGAVSFVAAVSSKGCANPVHHTEKHDAR
ncbi:MAG: polymerase, sigma-24 subunit, subfamily [Proteobacteria bacterium]|nr:polymerase, sigma-24 subunit, subfamily [Pseudomonadota bacterium]